MKTKVNWEFSCGRYYLTVAGYVVAMEGDPLRDIDLGMKLQEWAREAPDAMKSWATRDRWTGDLIKFVVAESEKHNSKGGRMKLSIGEKMLWAAEYSRHRTYYDPKQSAVFACQEIETLRKRAFERPETIEMFHDMMTTREEE